MSNNFFLELQLVIGPHRPNACRKRGASSHVSSVKRRIVTHMATWGLKNFCRGLGCLRGLWCQFEIFSHTCTGSCSLLHHLRPRIGWGFDSTCTEAPSKRLSIERAQT